MDPSPPTPVPAPTPTPAPTPEPVPPVDDGVVDGGTGGVDLLTTVVDVLPWALVAVLAVVVVLLLVERARRRRPSLAQPPRPLHDVSSDAAGAVPGALLEDLLVLNDLATTPAVAAHVRRIIRGQGLEPIEPAVGAPFDVDRHEVVATVAAPGTGHHERVARVHRPGWQSASGVLRPAAVELWVHQVPSGPSPVRRH